jgi:signal transduction histidine kinase
VRVHGKTVIGKDPAQDVVWTFDDITQEKERQARLEQARREAEQASRAKGSFLAVMSHEIRTPLNAIMGLTELLLAKQTSSEQREHLRTIQDSANHLNGIINDILDFSKIEAGKLVLDQVDFNLLEQLDAVTRVTDIQARRKGLEFTVNVTPDAPDVLRGDPGRLRQVLLNLLGNAMKFTEQGFVSLTVERASPS